MALFTQAGGYGGEYNIRGGGGSSIGVLTIRGSPSIGVLTIRGSPSLDIATRR